MRPNRTMELFADVLRSSMGDELLPETTSFLDMLTDDAVMEFPYAPPGSPRRLDGKVAIQQYLDHVGDALRIDRFSTPLVHRTARGFVLEFEGSGESTQAGRTYNQQYVSVIHLREGQIVCYRDYWNPLALLEALNVTFESGKERD